MLGPPNLTGVKPSRVLLYEETRRFLPIKVGHKVSFLTNTGLFRWAFPLLKNKGEQENIAMGVFMKLDCNAIMIRSGLEPARLRRQSLKV